MSWYPQAIRNPAPSHAGSHLGPVEVGVLHTTEGEFNPRSGDYFGHQSYPHFTVDVDDGVCYVYQHIDTAYSAKALANQAGGVETNRQGVIQIEVVGFASNPFTSDPVLVAGLKALMRWIESVTQIPRSSSVTFWQGQYGLAVPHRMSGSAWNAYKGWCGHQHVPENTHYDPGAIDINLLLASSTPKGRLFMYLTEAEEKELLTKVRELHVICDYAFVPIATEGEFPGNSGKGELTQRLRALDNYRQVLRRDLREIANQIAGIVGKMAGITSTMPEPITITNRTSIDGVLES